MEVPQFIKEAEDLIYKEVAKNVNLLLGKNKTAALSTGIFLKLPIKVTVEKATEPLPKLYKTLESFMPRFGAYVELGKTTCVNFTFLYEKENDLNALIRNFTYRSMFFAFVYIHEVQHIIRKHNTTSYDTMMLRIAKDIQDPHFIINVAEDHAINYSIKDLFMLSKDHVTAWPEIEVASMYDHRYHKEQLSDIEILKDLIASAKQPTSTEASESMMKVSMGGKDSLQPKESPLHAGREGEGSGESKTSTVGDDADISMADLSESIQDIIRTATKGTAAGDLMNELFGAIKVETGWFKKIKASFKRQVYYKTHDYSTSWSNINNTYRRIYKSPKKIFMDTKINIILSIDHSGSVATEDLQKLLYLIESESTRIAVITVLIHDTRVVKEFEIKDEYDISKALEFKEALATRHVVGGTSHDDVFRRIEDMKLRDPDKVIYMSFSDNYSDIEETVGNYPIMRKLTKYWICAGVNNPVRTAGTNIMMV